MILPSWTDKPQLFIIYYFMVFIKSSPPDKKIQTLRFLQSMKYLLKEVILYDSVIKDI